MLNKYKYDLTTKREKLIRDGINKSRRQLTKLKKLGPVIDEAYARFIEPTYFITGPLQSAKAHLWDFDTTINLWSEDHPSLTIEVKRMDTPYVQSYVAYLAQQGIYAISTDTYDDGSIHLNYVYKGFAVYLNFLEKEDCKVVTKYIAVSERKCRMKQKVG